MASYEVGFLTFNFQSFIFIRYLFHFRLHGAKLYGRKIVIDCSFTYQMNAIEQNVVAKQIHQTFCDNRMHRTPFDLHLFGVDQNSTMFTKLLDIIPKIKSIPLSIHSECFSDVLPAQNIVLLTSDSQHDLQFNFDDIYVVGGIHDMTKPTEKILAKAKRLNLKSAKFPLDQYLLFGEGDTKTLSVPESVNILRDFRQTKNWPTSLKNNVKKFKRLIDKN